MSASPSTPKMIVDGLTVRRVVLLHRADCACTQCSGLVLGKQTSTDPPQQMYAVLAAQEDPPAGWKRVPK